ncbi:hypothetical protein P692DRAFT_20203466 [Suillus brevipes Sb2]|nr:hypothetical protein P692DRAFT_20203466 [Suillus brevipes Sb2]
MTLDFYCLCVERTCFLTPLHRKRVWHLSMIPKQHCNSHQHCDLLANKDSLPQLKQAQIIKLKRLSIVSLAAKRRALLLQELQMPTIRDLEDLIIDTIYLDIPASARSSTAT